MGRRHAYLRRAERPVSYTHLDVYKRQVLTELELDDNAPALQQLLARSHPRHYRLDLGPASYTHLDVYKRQALCGRP
ncbi:hypothetical protein [Erwinia amylovora]